MLTLGLPRSSGVTHTITKGSIIPVQSSISSAASVGVHVPNASLADIQPVESACLGGAPVRREPAYKVFAVLWWCSVLVSRLYSPE